MNDDVQLRIFLLMLTARLTGSQQLADRINNSNITDRCKCLEYWDCVRSGGNFSSYCGLDESEVCCKLPRGDYIKFRSLQSNCGRKGKDTGRIGFAEVTEWPWHAAILEKANHIYVCGALLIDENWVLTAAHCVDDYVYHNDIRSLTVRLGEYDIRNSAEFHRHEEYDITSIKIHPNYSNRTLKNDIALLKLRFPVARRPNIDLVCVPKASMNFDSKKNCFVTGWGRRTEGDKHADILKEVEVPLWPKIRCNYILKLHFGLDYNVPQTILCAGSEGNDACEGDGGGPLVCEDTGQWYQIGIVSYGLGCGQEDTPGIYTKINEYESWIRDIVRSNY